VNAGKIESVLVLSPESPYPLHGGGQYRTASLIHYFARFAQVDLVLISESGKPALLPPGLVRSQKVIALPRHGKGVLERYARNARRAIRRVPPLIDRLSGLSEEIKEAIGNERYDLGVIEHFWLAPYLDDMQAACDEVALDLHNVESMLHHRCAQAGTGLIAAGHKRFAVASKELEAKLLPRFSTVLATSATDLDAAHAVAPGAKVVVYPNSLPGTAVEADSDADAGRVADTDPGVVVFSGNFEYHPNIDAARFLLDAIWPLVHQQVPGLRLRFVGRGDSHIRQFLPSGMGVEVTGPIENAREEIARAHLVVAPLRAGSGTRIKILEAWSAGKAVVATPMAAEGLAAEDGFNIVLAATAEAFADSILRLLADPSAMKMVGGNGKRTFDTRYTWEAAWASLDPIYHRAKADCPGSPDCGAQVARPAELSRYTG